MIHHSSSRTTTLLAVYHYNWPLRYAVVVTLKLAHLAANAVVVTLKLAHLAANARVLKPFVPAFCCGRFTLAMSRAQRIMGCRPSQNRPC